MNRKNLFYIQSAVLIFLIHEPCNAATIKGKVSDEKGEILPYATIFLEGTTIGTTTNNHGEYELVVSDGLYKVICQCIGYKQASFNVQMSGEQVVQHNFKLAEQSFEMQEVVIHANAEDPAYGIIRHAIERRQFHLDQVKSFQTSIYMKAVGRSRNLPDKFMGQKIKTDLDVDSAGKGVLFLSEEYADYYRKNDKEQTLIHSVRVSGDPNGVGFAQLPSVLTFYDNNVQLFSTRGSISPVSDNALFYYKYKLLGQFTEQGNTIYKIQVTQKRDFEPCFNGTIYIVDKDWAIHSVDLTLLQKSGITLFDTVRTQQVYLPMHPDEWVIKSQFFYLTAKILVFDITANAATIYNNQKINAQIPDSVFNKKITSIYDANANKKDTGYWKDIRPVPLVSDEKKNYVVQDSINRVTNSPEYLDSVRRKENRKINPIDFIVSGKTFSSKANKNKYGFSSLLFVTNFNTVEGLNIAPKLSWTHFVDTGKNLRFVVAPRYSFSNTHFNTIARLFYTTEDRHWKGKTWMYGIAGGKYVFQYNPVNPVVPILNTLTSLFWRENDLKIYERWDGAAYVNRNYGNGFSWFGRAAYQVRLPMDNTTYYSFYTARFDAYGSNLPAHLPMVTTWEKNTAALVNISLSYKPGYTYIQYPNYIEANSSNYPRFTLAYDKGIPDIGGSKSNFDKYRFGVSNDFHLKLFGLLSYRFAVGGFLNSEYVSVPDLMHLFGNSSTFGNNGIGFASPYLQSFQYAGYYDFSNKEPLYGEAHIEYKMKGLLSNKIPLFRRAQLYFIVGGNGFYASTKDYYYEFFAGLDNIGWKTMRFLRLDLIHTHDSNNGHVLGIRIGINGGGVTVSTSAKDATNSEW